MNFTEIRLKIRHFFRKNGKLVFLAFLIWAIIFALNLMLKNKKVDPTPTTTYEPHTSIMDSTKSTPKALQNPIEEAIKNYVDACNDSNYQKAFDMLSDDCKDYVFDNDLKEFMKHVLTKMPTPKEYAIQEYSTVRYENKQLYIYEVKYMDDFLATGLTDSSYVFTSEKFTFYEDDEGNLIMNIGDYLYHTDIKAIAENEYIKIDIVDKLVKYSTEEYSVRFTNRSNYTIVIADGAESDEVLLTLPNETRNRSETKSIVIKPGEDYEVKMTFPKFTDDGDISQSILFSSVRVMENYSGTENVDETIIKSEIDNAISKFSMEVKV